MKNIFNILEQNYIQKLFNDKKLIYFPDSGKNEIKSVEIEKKSPDWAKETCLAKYQIFFDGGDSKIVRGTASVLASKKGAWQLMNFLSDSDFNNGDCRIARPLDFIKENNALFYEEVTGIPLVGIFKNNNFTEINSCLRKSAGWLAKLHRFAAAEKNLPKAVFFGVTDYQKAFAKLAEIAPVLKSDLFFDTEIEFIKDINREDEVLIHNDFFPGNIIVDKEFIIGIDFEKSGRGARLADVATFWAWLEFPPQIKQQNLALKEAQSLQSVFLEAYCEFSGLNYLKTRQALNRFLVKAYFDQIYNYEAVCRKGWNFFDSAGRGSYQEKISFLIKKAKEYLSLI